MGLIKNLVNLKREYNGYLQSQNCWQHYLQQNYR